MKLTIVGAWLALLSALASGCCCGMPPAPFRIGPGDGGSDAPFVFPTDTGRDAFDASEPADSWVRPLAPCDSSGRVGAPCREGACGTGLQCGTLAPGAIQEVFALRQGERAIDETYATIQDPPDPSDRADFNGLAGSLCIQVCDREALTDGCGACASCSGLLTQAPLLESLGGALNVLPVADRTYGDATGICRLDCTFDPATAGDECPENLTCSALTSVCVERCTSDVECNTVRGVTYTGEIVTLVEDLHPASCNLTTGRCEHAGSPSASVGDACASTDDCAPGIGVCLLGLCAELGCDATSVTSCGSGHLCLGINERSTICLAGCNTPDDCGAGQACSFLGMPIAGLNGYCIEVCQSDAECIAGETCTEALDEVGALVAGHCEPTCDVVGARGALAGCAETEHCTSDAADHAGWCEPLGGFCDLEDSALSAASRDCGGGQICDELLATGGGLGFFGADVVGDGHCVDPCATDAGCAGVPGALCMTSGSLAGLCRIPCGAPSDCFATGAECDAVLGACVEP